MIYAIHSTSEHANQRIELLDALESSLREVALLIFIDNVIETTQP